MIKRVRTYFINLKQSYKGFKVDAKEEIDQTKLTCKLLWEYRKRSLTPEEIELVKTQGIDIFKLVCLSTIFVIPGGTFIIFILVKKGKRFGIKVLPSSFDNEKTKK